ncbi:hypothetical protein B0H11DRAFT_252788 [Mycena galericulata]|nr:hypothetical protein B0H11DRAFT_252788 [Mycena galericulata]
MLFCQCCRLQGKTLWKIYTSLLSLSLLYPFSTFLQNPLEHEVVIKIAQHLQEQEKSYKIITPYDAQRVLIEDSMKNTDGLHWEEKVLFFSLLQILG